MEKIVKLDSGKFYHVYNRGINNNPVFFESDNYNYFFKLYQNHIDPVAETYAWCLLKNHFHFLIKIKEENQMQSDKKPHQCFSNLINAYTKAINKRYHRNSSLFQRTFRRKEINNEAYLKNVIIYINNNPVKHQLCEHPMDYAWSSYLTIICNKPTKLKRESVIELFNDVDNFKYAHQIFNVDLVEF